jgi:hypothetical protein
MTTLKWADVYYKQVHAVRLIDEFEQIRIDDAPIDITVPLTFEDHPDEISIDKLVRSIYRIRGFTSDTCHPQLAFHIFTVTHRPSYMECYFPVIKSLNKESTRRFYEAISRAMVHQGFDLQLLDKRRNNFIATLPALGYLVAGHIVELFFYRQDILDRLLNSTIHILLYIDQDSFKADGGVAGGCYNPERKCLQLVVSRLFEGFNQPTAGVCPFLHEFGHLLDFFDAGTGKADAVSSGWLPGMRSSDGDIFTPEARETFIAGKQLEIQRYERQVKKPNGSDPLPIGHPYVFQSNSEFIAGYLEMFFRNPHYFATQNPDLFDGFARLLKQDPRQYWQADFPFYIQQNRDFYLSGQKPPIHGLTLDL